MRATVTLGQDVQALPPFSWCERCGKEVYRKQQVLCDKCNLKMQNAECKMIGPLCGQIEIVAEGDTSIMHYALCI